MIFHKKVFLIFVDIIGIWLIAGILLYGILPDAVKEKQGVWESLVISFLLSICVFIKTHFNKTPDIIHNDEIFSNLHAIANLIANWILFGLIYFSFLNDAQKEHEIWICVIYGGLVAFGFMGGKFVFSKKMRSVIKSRKQDNV